MENGKKIIANREIEVIASKIVDAAYTVHKNIGPGLLEKIYEVCFCHELTKRKVNYQRQVNIAIEYDGIRFEEGLRLDVLVENCIICEIKAAQIISHLKLTGLQLGFLINFNVPVIKNGIKRFINS